ncbi:MAG TPA: hypothetical protein VHP58_01630 [Alphaproteobacteria bacterium]|nr:hypothetical protein [Alphaproteobacteria bacterium]
MKSAVRRKALTRPKPLRGYHEITTNRAGYLLFYQPLRIGGDNRFFGAFPLAEAFIAKGSPGFLGLFYSPATCIGFNSSGAPRLGAHFEYSNGIRGGFAAWLAYMCRE